MYSESQINKMSPDELIQTVRKLSYSVENYLQDDAVDALDYLNNLIYVATSLRQSIESYIEE
jgi:hypothetical protein